ncbi:MAG: hypothetical protein JXR46_02465 [Calditrichaceae bacterium]|nr:hypothetical protein [Calditrichaceae bacterium]MBN2707886.1 hypothetical protein [Calditrichaceae bacterium]RQV97834.1 MAG: hypothetical protein EH224_00055 [Calditrichota bacterium]
MAKLVLIKNFPNRAFAEQARSILKSKNIDCILQSPDPGILGVSSVSVSQGVNLLVDENQAETARELLFALFDGI